MPLFFKNNWFSILLLLALTALLIVENVNGRFHLHDFEVYYTAAKNLLEGEAVYGQAYGLDSGYYKYAPFALLLFTPFALLPFSVAKIVYYLLLTVVLWATLQLTYRLLQAQFKDVLSPKYQQIILALTTLITAVHLFRELHLGNINLLLLCLFVSCLYLFTREKIVWAGLLMGFGILLKPHFIVLLPLLVIRRKVVWLGSSLLAIALGLLLPALFLGSIQNLTLHQEWINAILEHQTAMHSYQTIYVLINKLGFHHFIASNNIYFIGIILAVIAWLCLVFVVKNIYEEKKLAHIGQAYFVLEFLLLLALVPNITITDTEHFLLSLPLIMGLLYCLFQKKYPTTLGFGFIAICLLAFLLYGGNWHDLLGRDLSKWATQNGLLGIGNLLLLGLVVYSKKRFIFIKKITSHT